MMTLDSTLLCDSLAGVSFFLALSFISSWIASTKGYYSLPYKNFKGGDISLQDVLSTFFIFIGVYFLVLPIFHNVIASHFIAFLLTLFLFILYAIFSDQTTMVRIIKDKEFPDAKSLKSDIFTGFIYWIIAMPVVASITYLSEMITSLFFTPSGNDQVAVRFLKESLNDPATTIVAFFSILIVAPLFEEFLFRGILQSYIRVKLGVFASIFFSSVIFALFHFSPTQSVENITLLVTLFVFGIYLGFAYEKTRSLVTSIFLHVTFNSVSVIRIIFTTV